MLQTITKPMEGYKAFNSDLTCLDMQYEIGKEYVLDGEPILCKQGFHFCKTVMDCYRFYPAGHGTRICKVEAFGTIVTKDETKYCTNKLRVIEEVLDAHVQTNVSGTNTGCFNSGSWNSGDYNAGSYNSGYWNVGDENSGDWNVGDKNSGKGNTGSHNIGNWNVGSDNTGNRNVGSHNTGNRNTGDWNVSNGNNGCFMTVDQKIPMFNKPSDWTYEDWNRSAAKVLLDKLSLLDNAQKWWDSLNTMEQDLIKQLPNFDADIFFQCTGIHVDGKGGAPCETYKT